MDSRLFLVAAGAGLTFLLSCVWARVIFIRVRKTSKPASFMDKLVFVPFSFVVALFFFGAAYVEVSTGLQWLPLHGKYSTYVPVVPLNQALYWLGIVFCYFAGITVSAIGVSMLWPKTK